jgi:acetyltransferase-like isoleucine patch superfamily enzyme
MASRLAAYLAPPYHNRRVLAWMNKKGYVSPSSTIHHKLLRLGDHVFVDDGVGIYQGIYPGEPGGEVSIGHAVSLYDDVTIQTGDGGSVVIGDSTFILSGCIIAAYKGSVLIGRNVMISPNCCFYPYNHGMVPGMPMAEQPLTSSGDIIIEDEAWISTGVIILDGVRVGKGAVVGAGSVVTRDIPDNAIAFGVPAKVIKMRGD